MDIADMHYLFRTIGQQMGLERVRGILDESIDDFLNAAIIDTATNIVKSNVQTIFKDKFTIQDNAISPLNGVSTLYEEKVKSINDGSDEVTSVTINVANVMYCIGFSIKYREKSQWRNCRIIEPTKIESSLDDYCNRASARYPIVNVISTDPSDDDIDIEIYHGKSDIEVVKIKYIRMPVSVKYDISNSANSVNCDLPVHLHKDVVELAVQKFFNSVGSTSHNIR